MGATYGPCNIIWIIQGREKIYVEVRMEVWGVFYSLDKKVLIPSDNTLDFNTTEGLFHMDGTVTADFDARELVLTDLNHETPYSNSSSEYDNEVIAEF